MREDCFYDDGLRFECTRCSNCCSDESGHVFLSATDLTRLAQGVGLTVEAFFLEYCEVVDLELAVRVSLKSEDNGDCVFLANGSCEVYGHRPLQCRAYPFWGYALVDRESFAEVTCACPGVGQDRLWSREEIETWLEQFEREPLLDVGESEPRG